ncbi:MAG: AAA family ATPase [Pseudomonadota bacterium]
MTLYKPTLILKSLLLKKGTQVAYEAKFHAGLNVIRGQNGSGKSTITELIFYALGGEMTDWKRPAESCDFVYAEVEVNGKATTLCREITPGNASTGMEIFWGSLEDALTAQRQEWQRYPYRGSANKESFSQIIFKALGFPQVRGEETSNITMNQVLRLMYADQLTPGARIFKLQEKWDSGLLRQTVGDLLCGVYDDHLYEARLSLNQKRKILEVAVAQLRNIFHVLGRAEQDAMAPDLEQQALSISQELARLHDQLSVYKNTATLIDGRAASKAKSVETKYVSDIAGLSETILKLSTERDEIAMDTLDSVQFLAELNRRLVAIKDSENTESYLGQVKFNQCPCCMATIKPSVEGSSVCELCKGDSNESDRKINIFRMRNELETQIRESEKIMVLRKSRAQALISELTDLNDRRNEAYRKLKGFSKQWPTETELLIDNANVQIGKLKQELVSLREKQKLQEMIKRLQDERDAMNAEVTKLEDFIKARENLQVALREEAYKEIEKYVIEILHQDLKRQDDFSNATSASIDFDGNSILVNGIKTFSASSLVLLKNAFHLAFILASTKKDFFRYPRLLILDGIEDGGMEELRSHNFQEIIQRYSDSLAITHQIIFTTAKLSPKLNDDKYLIGPEYSTANRTLRIPVRGGEAHQPIA